MLPSSMGRMTASGMAGRVPESNVPAIAGDCDKAEGSNSKAEERMAVSTSLLVESSGLFREETKSSIPARDCGEKARLVSESMSQQSVSCVIVMSAASHLHFHAEGCARACR